MTERRDGDRIVVCGASEGNHFPRTQAETQYSWSAVGDSAEGPFRVAGSVYGRDLSFSGAGEVEGPVLGRGDVTLRPKQGAGRPRQNFYGGLAATGAIVTEGPRVPLTASLAHDLESARVVIRGDVMASSVALRNAVVLGNVEAPRVELEQCLVLGATVASERLLVRASTLLHYYAGEVTFEGPCTAIHAMGESRTRPVFAAYEDADGAICPSQVLFYPAMRALSGRGLTRGQGALSPDAGGRSELFPQIDWARVEVNVPVVRAIDGQLAREIDRQERYVLTIAGRCLDFRGVESALRAVASILRTGLEWSHYSAEVQGELARGWDREFTDEERSLLSLVTGRAAA